MNDVGIDELAVAIARAQDQRLADDRSRRLLGVREALLADPRVGAPASRPTWLTGVVALAVVAVLAVGAGLWLRAPDRAPLTFTVGDESLARVEALWIAAPAAPIDVAFSDGSQLVLAQGSRARVDTATHATGRVVLESGGIAVKVGEGMLVDAGPFALALADVECEVAWDGTAQRLGLVVQRGRVHVSGPGDQAHDVVAGQRIEISPQAAQLAVAAPLTPVAPDTAPIAAPTAEPEIEPDTVTRPQARRRGAPAASVPDWSTLARASKHREALAAAEALGFDRLCDSLDAGALLRLADVARFAGKSTRADEALTALRRRHPSAEEAAVAAYTLGRLAAGARRHAEAAAHFATYLRERPKGSLAREAMGRMLEAEAAAGFDARADATARRYLELYPSGPHADLAAARSR